MSPAGNSLRSEQGSPKFLGNHNCPFAMFHSDAGRTVYTRPYGATAWPLVIEGQRLPRKVFRRSIALLSDSLSTLRSADYSNTTQDSLPVAGQALLGGLSTRKVPVKGFKVVDYISFPFPRLSWRKRCDRSSHERRTSSYGGREIERGDRRLAGVQRSSTKLPSAEMISSLTVSAA